MNASTGIVRSVTGAEVEHFEQYGFVRLKRILTECAVERLRRAAAIALGTFEASPSSYDLTRLAQAGGAAAPFCAAPFGSVRDSVTEIPLADARSDPSERGHYRVDSGLWRRVDAMREFALHSEFPEMAVGLIGANAVRFYDDQLVVKEPATRESTAFHQDLSYLHVDGDKGCVFSLFLDRTRHGTGRPGFVPSSHRWGQIFKPNILVESAACAGSEGADLPGIENAPDSFGVQYVDVEPGDVLIHHVLTLQGMEANRGMTACRALGFCYVDAAMHFRRRPGVAIPLTHNPTAREGAEMDGKAHPLVWPRFESEAMVG